jgi:flagellar biogenesis protein FliO
MPNFSEPVTMTFIVQSIAMIFVLVGIGIFAVKKFKKEV